MDSPTPRYPEVQGEPDMDIKEGPCGRENDSRTTDETRITTFEAGSTITVEWRETIPHTGWFRIAFDDDGQDDFPASPTSGGPPSATSATYPILKDGILSGGMRNMAYSTEITLPNTPCDNCTLQLIQVMTDRPQNPPYFTCADIVLTAPAGTGGTGGMGGSGGMSGAAGASGAGAGGVNAGGAGGGSGTAGVGGVGGSGGGGAGGISGVAGTSGTGSAGTPASGGAGASAGGSSGSTATAGTSSAGTSAAGSGGTSTAGGTGGTSTTTAGTASQPAAPSEPAEEGGCSIAGGKRASSAFVLLGLGALFGLGLRRRSRRS